MQVAGQYLLSLAVRKIHKSAWLLVLLSAALQVAIFPLPNWYFLCWIAVAPLLIALLRARRAETLQFTEGAKLLPAQPGQAFLLAYLCGIIWNAGTYYWIYNTMRQYGGVSAPAALGILVLYCMYLGLYFGVFGLIVSWLAGKDPYSRRALLLSPLVWVAVELARTRISGVPWNLLGTAQVDNIPLARIAAVAGVYGLSFEIMIVNAAFAAVFLAPRNNRKLLLAAALGASLVLQGGSLFKPPALPTDHLAVLLQQNVPAVAGADWTKEYFNLTMQNMVMLSETSAGPQQHPDLIVWPESPAPFFTSDPSFRSAISDMARQTQAWVVTGNIGVHNAGMISEQGTQVYNSASLVAPSGEWTARYDKVHLVPFGEYVPLQELFSFAGGLTKEVGDFTAGGSRVPLKADGTKLGVFICYESVFPGEIRQFAANGAQVFVNISNDGWYGDSGAYAQHLKQVRMRAVENGRWLLRDTNTGVTASIDPYGRVVASVPRKTRVALLAPYALSNVTTLYTRYGDWFAYLCAIISGVALLLRIPFRRRKRE